MSKLVGRKVIVLETNVEPNRVASRDRSGRPELLAPPQEASRPRTKLKLPKNQRKKDIKREEKEEEKEVQEKEQLQFDLLTHLGLGPRPEMAGVFYFAKALKLRCRALISKTRNWREILHILNGLGLTTLSPM